MSGQKIIEGLKDAIEGRHKIMEREMDYTKMDGPTMLREMGLDGMKWTEAFRQLNPNCNVEDDVMLGWFCNAIMNTLDIERGTIHNGDHAQYLIDNGLTP